MKREGSVVKGRKAGEGDDRKGKVEGQLVGKRQGFKYLLSSGLFNLLFTWMLFTFTPS